VALKDGDSVTLAITNRESSSITVSSGSGFAIQGTEHTHNVTIPNHTHPVEPGLNEFGTETSEDVGILINGVRFNSNNIGSGNFKTVEDISGRLNKGEWNLIELASNSLCFAYATLVIDAYRNDIGTQ
jgi:RecB family endonuclease NucS